MKRVSKAGALVLATSEVSRGWYRSGKERIDPLAAFKESGGIEYGLALGFVMLGVEDDEGEPIPGFSDVFTAKNRVGTVRPIFRLRQDFTSARFEEVGRPPASRGRKPKGTDEPIDSRILRTARDGHYATAEDLQRDVVGRRTTVLEAIRDLREAGRLVLVGGRLRPAVGGHDD